MRHEPIELFGFFRQNDFEGMAITLDFERLAALVDAVKQLEKVFPEIGRGNGHRHTPFCHLKDYSVRGVHCQGGDVHAVFEMEEAKCHVPASSSCVILLLV